ncbi:MAG: hypothetical protein NC936_05030, partial [Candidatus Omnitrophica bacterium]|nr:hypothetical protein [Candidatus Omnitrophota bacterium]
VTITPTFGGQIFLKADNINVNSNAVIDAYGSGKLPRYSEICIHPSTLSRDLFLGDGVPQEFEGLILNQDFFDTLKTEWILVGEDFFDDDIEVSECMSGNFYIGQLNINPEKVNALWIYTLGRILNQDENSLLIAPTLNINAYGWENGDKDDPAESAIGKQDSPLKIKVEELKQATSYWGPIFNIEGKNNIYIEETDGLELGQGVSKNFYLKTGGAITDFGEGLTYYVLADDLILSASDGIGTATNALEIAATNFQVKNSVSRMINIDDISGGGSLTLKVLDYGLSSYAIDSVGDVKIAGANIKFINLDGDFTLAEGKTFTVNGNLRIKEDADLDASRGTVDINGDLELEGGTFTAPSGNMYISGDFIKRTPATFVHSLGTIIFDGADTSQITGENTFYNLKCHTPAKEIQFEADKTQTILNNLDIKGTFKNPVKLRSASSGEQFIIDNRGEENIFYADVKDARAVNSITAIMSYDRGNNLNWIFFPKVDNYTDIWAEFDPDLVSEYSGFNLLFITDIIQHLETLLQYKQNLPLLISEPLLFYSSLSER